MFVSAVKLLDLLYLLYFRAKSTLLFGFEMLELEHFKPPLCFSSGLHVGLCHCGLSEGDREAGGEEKDLLCLFPLYLRESFQVSSPHPAALPPSGSCLAVFHHLQQQPRDAPFLISQPSPLELLPLVYPS